MPMKPALIVLTAAIAQPVLAAIVPVGSSTTDWIAVSYRNAVSDAPADNQANIADLELIGNVSNPAFYTRFDDNGTEDPTDGAVGFRMRMSGDQGNPQFHGDAWVGMDVNRDGSLDLFMGANDNMIGIYALDGGSGDSPSNTRIAKTPEWSEQTNSLNFSWTPVTFELDPGATSLDIDNEAGNDYFITFSIPFLEVVQAVDSLGIVARFDDTSTISYVSATSTQGNTLNSDINGIEGGVNSPGTWLDFKVISDESDLDGTPVVPEPGTAALALGLGAAVAVLIRRSRKTA